MTRLRPVPRARRLRDLATALPDGADLPYEAITGQIAVRRAELGLSQRELADLCGTTQSAIARLERGGRPPRIDTLRRIAAALDCELIVELRPKTTQGGRK